MDDTSQLETALLRADAAGDTAAATALAGEIRRLRATSQIPSAPITDRSAPWYSPENIAGSKPARFAIGAAEPILGGVQAAANMLPESWGAGKAVNEHMAQLEGMIQQGRRQNTQPTLENLVTGKEADPGFDWTRLGGNILSPVNAGLAKTLPAATSTFGRVGVGMAAGGAGAALTPVTEGGDFWANKGMQTVGGVAVGGLTTPVIGKIADKVAPRVLNLLDRMIPSRGEVAGAKASMATDQAIAQALQEIGAKADDLSKAEMQALRDQVIGAMKQGKQVDPAALLRQKDFTALGIEPTQGQLTRDATQFATEQNLRGVPNVGKPLQTRFDVQNQRIQNLVSQLRGNPSEAYPAGKKIIGSLAEADAGLKAPVDQAYAAARDNLGRAAPVNAAEFSTKANLALDEGMLGHYLPAEVKGILNDVSAGKIPFNVNTMVQIDSVLSSAQRAAGYGTPQHLAIGKVRDALNAATIESNVGEDAKKAFDLARGLAAGRFAAHRGAPALEAAVSKEAPDKFVQKYILGGNVEDLQRTAKLLSPDAFQEAKAQFGAAITRAAFSENTAGDKLVTPDRLAKTLRTIGEDKLGVFFNSAEIDTMKTLARVSAYINSRPSSSPVNTSNNIGAITSLASKIPGMGWAGTAAGALKSMGSSLGNQSAVNKAVNSAVPSVPLALDPEKAKLLARLLAAGVGGTGMAVAAPF